MPSPKKRVDVHPQGSGAVSIAGKYTKHFDYHWLVVRLKICRAFSLSLTTHGTAPSFDFTDKGIYPDHRTIKPRLCQGTLDAAFRQRALQAPSDHRVLSRTFFFRKF
jgi:hypothetical protein